MSAMRPTLRQLEYVVALADTLNFRRAAEACFVTQPGLSSQLKQLETLLGVTLFERDRRRVLITPAGEAVVAHARQVLEQLDSIVEVAHSLGEPLSGPLRLGVIPTIAPYLLPIVLPELLREYPLVKPILREDHTAKLVDLVETGQLDVALFALEAEIRNLETMPLFRDRFFVALASDHPLAKRKRLRVADLEDQEFLLLEEGHCLRDQALPVCSAGSARVADFRATSLPTLIQMVASGAGMTLLPEMAVEEAKERSSVVVLPIGPESSRTIALGWRRSSPSASSYRLLGDVFRKAVGE